jgi:glucan phosphorylase
LIFQDIGRVTAIARQVGSLQIVFVGMAHPRDQDGKNLSMQQAIALNGGFFNTQRMMAQYLHNAYRLVGEAIRRG